MLDWTKLMYDGLYHLGRPHWDSDHVPAPIVALAENREIRTVLDLGCGTGTNAIYLAQHGRAVTGVDFSPAAIKAAGAKAGQAGVQVDWSVGDVTRLDFLSESFDLVLDIGCFHGLDAAGRARYATHLARLTHPVSLFLLWGFDRPIPWRNSSLAPAQVQTHLGPHFGVSQVQEGVSTAKRQGTWYWLVRRETAAALDRDA